MSAAQSLAWPEFEREGFETDFRSIFEHAPLATALCNREGIILEANPAFEKVLNGKKAQSGVLRLNEVFVLDDDEQAGLSRVFEGNRTSVRIQAGKKGDRGTSAGWMVWRIPGVDDAADRVLLMDESQGAFDLAEKDLLQVQRWEAVGQLTGGVVHDFNNLLTGVILYCDLLLSSLDTGDQRVRRYAEEIRAAVAQATALIRRLLVFARVKSHAARPLCLNQVAEMMRDLLARLIGENIALELRLDPVLGLVEMDWAQAEQILLNLILNARDALPNGGCIVVETSNCKFERVNNSAPVFEGTFPCVLLAVSDNGCGMDAKIKQHLFEPFFTTKASGKGTGLGLATVHSVVTGNCGLVHVESEAGCGTRVMILLPQSLPHETSLHLADSYSNATNTILREVKKEPCL